MRFQPAPEPVDPDVDLHVPAHRPAGRSVVRCDGDQHMPGLRRPPAGLAPASWALYGELSVRTRDRRAVVAMTLG